MTRRGRMFRSFRQGKGKWVVGVVVMERALFLKVLFLFPPSVSYSLSLSISVHLSPRLSPVSPLYSRRFHFLNHTIFSFVSPIAVCTITSLCSPFYNNSPFFIS